MIIEIPDKELFAYHAELNQICGAIIGILEHTPYSQNITTAFPKFVELLDKVNNEMQKHAIT